MKKFLFSVFIITAAYFNSHSQAILLQQNFDSYNGLVASIPAGFTITWNDTASISKSFYNTTGFCGVACNSYKFGWDSATIITPAFSNPGSVSFYFKGNGTQNPYNTFYVYESPNGSTWNQVASYVNFVTTSQTITLPLNSSSIKLKFYYEKDSLGLNVGFDDLIVYGPLGVNETKGFQGISVYPTPTSGIVTINFNENYFSDIEIKVINILGKEVKNYNLKNISTKYVMNITDEPEGIYLLKIKSGTDEMVKRIILKK
ncbi:MAG TPA: T9SS type A sorting domain-containing protein [Bacteroidia bacterium]|nr:T9SS type A sorting domain-containing protein [Bacteroidia bacterium]